MRPDPEEDSNDVLEVDPTFPTRDSVQVVADGQALFSLTTDPAKIEVFYKKYGRRKWRGEEISTEAGWVNQQEKAYRANPTQRDIDKIRAFCGADGCDPRVIGGGLDGIIADLSK